MASATGVCNTYSGNWFVGYEGRHRAHRSLQNHIEASNYSSVHAGDSSIAHGVSCQRLRRMVRSSSIQLLNETYFSELGPHFIWHTSIPLPCPVLIETRYQTRFLWSISVIIIIKRKTKIAFQKKKKAWNAFFYIKQWTGVLKDLSTTQTHDSSAVHNNLFLKSHCQ